MRFTFLGTGTSHGIPVIGCDCAVCRSPDPRNRRLRASIWLEHAGRGLLVDTGPDLRAQALRAHLPRVDAVCCTHAHADHIFGFDDLRRFYEMQGAPIPVYAAPATLAELRRLFAYVEIPQPESTSFLRVAFTPLTDPHAWHGLTITPVPVFHGRALIHGFVFAADGRRLGYVPDCSGWPPASQTALSGLDVLVLDALRPEPHPTHFCLADALAAIATLAPRQAYLTHLCHRLEHRQTQAALPPGVDVAYDGLVVDLRGSC
ncbi:MAG: MBL fold metallo-hydrolase [Candidatus Marinimicrobia bacterium]|nr:MBL fold metallo-hydrolase [Candidatus Neomarinimicrobiota bacterium]